MEFCYLRIVETLHTSALKVVAQDSAPSVGEGKIEVY